MKICFQKAQAFTMVEVLVYMSVLTVVLGLAFSAFYQCQEHSTHLHNNAQQIARALRAGEQWRRDIRQSGGMIVLTEGSNTLVRLPSASGETAYAYTGSNVMRHLPGGRGWQLFLDRVKNSEMRLEKRNDISVCSWELELLPVKKNSRVKPLFSFMAVPEDGGAPK
jgi:type II secretory pathway component PulJ